MWILFLRVVMCQEQGEQLNRAVRAEPIRRQLAAVPHPNQNHPLPRHSSPAITARYRHLQVSVVQAEQLETFVPTLSFVPPLASSSASHLVQRHPPQTMQSL